MLSDELKKDLKNLKACQSANDNQISILARIKTYAQNLENDRDFFISETEKRILEINKKNELLNIAIQNIIDLCDHSFKYIGSDGMQTYSKCEHCGQGLVTYIS